MVIYKFILRTLRGSRFTKKADNRSYLPYLKNEIGGVTFSIAGT